jgi:serine/threonine-protein kinase
MPTSFEHSYSFNCLVCHQSYQIQTRNPAETPLFCPLCGSIQISDLGPNQTIVPPYKVLETIGKGGMGEVFSAFDPSCKRVIAIKRIRPDLIDHPQIRHRFLKEALITCQLTHPAIIPIYAIQSNPSTVFYTMPLVEGETLKQILRKTRQQEKKGEKLDHIGGSIPALMRIFMTICQAVAYAHSKGILHRDLKPENVIIGRYGEVLILDWGLAKWIDQKNDEDSEVSFNTASTNNLHQTRTGKVVGTIAYMAPERAIGEPATIQTDIYSLGVILYQLLALKSPFRRKSLEDFRRNIHREELLDPLVASPYRDIPKMLAQYTLKCLAKNPNDRYRTVDDLVHDLEAYVEGRSEWFHTVNLDVHNKSDWEFQENILLAPHLAITRMTEEAEWVSLMISQQSFSGNTKIETKICLNEESCGIGFLFGIPESSERTHLNEGYCLWIGSDSHRTTKLSSSSVEIMVAPDIFLSRHHEYTIRIEKIEKSIHLYINDILQLTYLSQLPITGTHIGLLSRDADFDIKPISVYVGSLNLTVNCLAIPDAFLAHRDYPKALSEYRRIAYSFPDRPEGREALFKAGLTFIEQAKNQVDNQPWLNDALHEFEKLHGTPSAPLQYLGKALVYEILNDNEEEIKCFELAYRRYQNHPLLLILQEQILSRMHEVSRNHRLATYRFILLSIQYLPKTALDTHTLRLFTSLQKHWEILPFIDYAPLIPQNYAPYQITIPLAFWLGKPYILGEILNELSRNQPEAITEISNALFCLLELGSWSYAKKELDKIQRRLEANTQWSWLETVCACHQMPLDEVAPAFKHQTPTPLESQELRAFLYFIDQALDQKQTKLVHQCLDQLAYSEITFEQQLKINARQIWAFLIEKEWQKAGEIFNDYSIEFLNKETSILHFLYGCWLQATEGDEIAHIHFMGLLSVTYPRSWTLASHYLTGQISLKNNWFAQAFLWEKRELYQQLALYYHCAGDESKKLEFEILYRKQFINVEP